VEIDGGRIAARTTFWTAGVAASPAATWRGQAGDKSGRILVDDNPAVPPGIRWISERSDQNEPFLQLFLVASLVILDCSF
jgi:hypothetical protein